VSQTQSGAESHLPLKPIALQILLALESADRHGYGIRQQILDETAGRVEIEAGNLYRHLRVLEDEGLLKPVAPPRGETDPRRIYYRLQPLGRSVMRAELRRLQSLVSEAEKRGIITRRRA
jgi:DNA-binding PadR family transcriptional regulator